MALLTEDRFLCSGARGYREHARGCKEIHSGTHDGLELFPKYHPVRVAMTGVTPEPAQNLRKARQFAIPKYPNRVPTPSTARGSRATPSVPRGRTEKPRNTTRDRAGSASRGEVPPRCPSPQRCRAAIARSGFCQCGLTNLGCPTTETRWFWRAETRGARRACRA